MNELLLILVGVLALIQIGIFIWGIIHFLIVRLSDE
jgi:hypothetical protein